tara:strand:- start:1266 stop:2963 length:1698 start_codon:yes stop_codon:yes gene_type:complete
MTGGLMNLVAYGSENLLFNGNPKKTFFKATYQKYSNFGLQRFRIDYEGTKDLNLKTGTVLDYKIPRYADMLYDTYFVFNLPNIYSPFYHYYTEEGGNNPNLKNNYAFAPYEFCWIEELGTNMIEEIEVYSGGVSLAKYSGEYLNCLKERDYSDSKKDLWNRMTGNIVGLNNPGNANGNVNSYPNCQWSTDALDIEPSIRGRQLFIPLDAFFCESSKMALPLVALQYQEINIRIRLKPIMDLYTINDVEETPGNNGLSYRMRPNKNVLHHELWRFLQPPKDIYASTSKYNQNISSWAADPHLIGTYVFLGQAERRIIASQEQKLLIKQVYEYKFLDVNGSRIVEIESKDMVSNYMWRFRRSDAYLRNEWSNYTNWPYNNIQPQSLQEFSILNMPNPANHYITGNIGNEALAIQAANEGRVFTQHPINLKEIMIDLGITMDGVYRETVLPSGVFEYMEKYMRTSGGARNGLYMYNFCLDSNKRTYQPSGAMNVNKFKKVFFEFNTIEPPIDLSGSNIEYICDLSGNAIGFRKTVAQLNQYSYDLKIFEERYNIMIIQGGRVGLMHAR